MDFSFGLLVSNFVIHIFSYLFINYKIVVIKEKKLNY